MFGISPTQFCVLITIWIGVYCNYVCYSVIAPFFPQLARKKGLSAEQYSIVFAVYSLAQIIFSLIVGKYLSRIGAKFVVVTGLLVTGIATILFGCLERVPAGDTFFVLSVCIRFIEGAGFAAYFTSVLAIIVETFPADPGYYVGLTESVVTIGMIMGPPMGSFLYEVGGYATPFISFGTVMLMISLLAVFSVRSIGSNYENLEEKPLNTDSSLTLREYLEVLRLPAAILTVLCVTLNVVADIFVLITLGSHLQQFNLTTMQIGCIYLCLFLSYGLSSPLAGKIADRTNQEFLLQFLGSLVVLVSFTLIGPMLFFPGKAQLHFVILGLLLKGLGAGPLISCSYSSCLKAARYEAGRKDDFHTYTLVSTIVSFSIPLGNLIGGFSAGVMYEHLGMPTACTIFVGIFFVLALLCLAQHLAQGCRNKRIVLKSADDGSIANGFIGNRRVSSESTPLCLCHLIVDERPGKHKKKRSYSNGYNAI